MAGGCSRFVGGTLRSVSSARSDSVVFGSRRALLHIDGYAVKPYVNRLYGKTSRVVVYYTSLDVKKIYTKFWCGSPALGHQPPMQAASVPDEGLGEAACTRGGSGGHIIASLATCKVGVVRHSGHGALFFKHLMQKMEAGEDFRIRILTYNVNWGYCRAGLATAMCHRIVQAIKDAEADVVCLQETHDGWEQFLSQEFKARYPHMTWRHHLIPHVKTHLAEGSSAGGLGFMSIYPLYEVFHTQPEVAGSFFPGACVTVQTPAGNVDILNIHLRPPVSNSHKPSVMALFQTGLIRKAELKYFISEMCEQSPALVVGDFNESRSGDAIRWLMSKGRGYQDALALHDENAVTWKWPLRMGLCLKGSYDHLMFMPARYVRNVESFNELMSMLARLQAVSCHVLTQYELISDHMPVCATFIVKPTSPLSLPSHMMDSGESAENSPEEWPKSPRRQGGSKRKPPLVRVTSDVVSSSETSLGTRMQPQNPAAYDLVDTTGLIIPRRASFPDHVGTAGQPLLSPRGRARALGGLVPCGAGPCDCLKCTWRDVANQPPLFAARSAQALSTGDHLLEAACTADSEDIPWDADEDIVLVSMEEAAGALDAEQGKKKRGARFFSKAKKLS